MTKVVALLCAFAGAAAAEPGVDVKLHDAPPDEHRLAIVVNPLPLVFGKASADLILVPIDHIGLVVNVFYSYASTAPIVIQNSSGSPMLQLPEQKFTTFGGEVGLRYYRGARGPRGLFVGPSLILARVHEQQGQFGDGSHTDYADIGLAADIGYAVLIDHVALAVGGGVQGIITSKTIPAQQFPAKIYADSGILPRLLFSVGYAF
jgi:hypothetical protein